MSKSFITADLQWKASQGCPKAQRQLAAAHYQHGDLLLAEFWEAKSNGHPAFSLENYLLNKK